MQRTETFSEYVDRLSAKLQDGSRSSQTQVLVREIADLRLQVQSLSAAIAALASYQEIAPLLQGPDTSSLQLPRRVHLDASQHLHMLDGFYALEYTESGMAYRWTGPRPRFRFSVWIDRQSLVDVALSVIFCGNPGNVLNTRLFVDDVMYLARFDGDRNVFHVEGVRPREHRGLSVFEFELAGPFVDPHSQDTRELGLPFVAFEAVCRETAAADVAPHG
jgi:hypothetical protein